MTTNRTALALTGLIAVIVALIVTYWPLIHDALAMLFGRVLRGV